MKTFEKKLTPLGYIWNGRNGLFCCRPCVFCAGKMIILRDAYHMKDNREILMIILNNKHLLDGQRSC